MDQDRFRELLAADVAVEIAAATTLDAAQALQRFWEKEAASVVDALGLGDAARAQVEAEVARLIEAAEGNPAVAVARRGGIDRDIHTSLRPQTSRALLQSGAGARAPLRPLAEDRYRDFSVIGKGGMGVVYLALDTELNRRVAFKMVRPDPDGKTDDPAPHTPLGATPPTMEDEDSSRSFEELKIRFLQEAWVTGGMEHPGITPVYELGQTRGGIPYYTMRYVRGERTLANALEEADDVEARLALIEPFLKVCDAVRYAHARGVVHRDLKPDNIALGEFGEAVVLDWGLSKMQDRPDVSGSMWRSKIHEYRDATDLRSVAGALGTPGYMSPEAALGQGEAVGPRSDIYSLGAILYQILTGELPHTFKTFVEYIQQVLEEPPTPAHEAAPGVPEELGAVCQRALARQAEERYESVDALAADVRRWQTEGPLQRQIAELLRDARAEIAGAERTTGNIKIWHLDRAASACTKVLHLEQGHAEALALASEIKQARESRIRERVWVAQRKALVVAAVVLLAAVAFTVLQVDRMLDRAAEAADERVDVAKRDAAEAGRERDAAERIAARAQTRLADGYAAMAERLCDEGRGGAARLFAARALTVAATPDAWRALARAESVWAPPIRAKFVVDSPVRHMAYGREIALACEDTDLRLVDVTTGAERRLAGPGGLLTALAYSPDGALVAAGSAEGRIRVWDRASGKVLRDFPQELLPKETPQQFVGGDAIRAGSWVGAMVITAKPTRLYAAYNDRYLRCWDPAAGTICGAMRRSPARLVLRLRAGPLGKYIYAANVGDPPEVDQITRSSTVVEHTVSIDGATYAMEIVGGEDGTSVHVLTSEGLLLLYGYDTDERLLVHDMGIPHVFGAAITPDLKLACIAEESGAITVHDVDGRRLAARLEAPPGKDPLIELAPDGRTLAVASGKEVVCWDLAMRAERRGRETASAVAWNVDSTRCYLARPGGDIEAWDAENGRLLNRWPAHRATITALTLDDDERIVSTGLDGVIRIFDSQGATVQSCEGPAAPTAVLGAAKDQILVGTLDGALELWHVRLGRKVRRLDGAASPVVRIERAGEQVVARYADGGSGAWILATGEPVDVPRASIPVQPPAKHAPPLLGSDTPWILKNPTLRLIEYENRYALRLAGFTVEPVARAAFTPDVARIEPWSK